MNEIKGARRKHPIFKDADNTVEAVKPMIADPNKEFFIALYLNTKNGILKQSVISIGI